MKTLMILNSDFGQQIGARAYWIAKEIKNKEELEIISRSKNKKIKNEFNQKTIFPFAKLTMQILTAIPIYITKKIPVEKIKTNTIEHFLIRKLHENKIQKIKLLASWNFLPKTYKHIKEKYPKIKIIQDVPIALPNILKNIKNSEKVFKNEKQETAEYIKKSFKYIDYFIVPSEFVKQSLIMENISENKIFIVPFGVDSKKFKPIKKKERNFSIAFSGNVNNRKGIPYLIQAWKELKKEMKLPKEAKLNIYGRIYPEVKKHFKEEQKYNIKTHGFIDLTKELPKNHIYVFPSLMEGSAKSIYEAMACGLPVITTFNAGSVITSGKEGFIIPAQNVKAIKKKILFFYNNRKQIEEMGIKARKTAEKYTWEKYGEKVTEIYKKVMK